LIKKDLFLKRIIKKIKRYQIVVTRRNKRKIMADRPKQLEEVEEVMLIRP
jgi:hypothetical protein